MVDKTEKFLLYSGAALGMDWVSSLAQRNIVFIWIPKTAGTSLVKAINARKLKTLRQVRYRLSSKGIVTFGHISYKQLVDSGYVSRRFDKTAVKLAVVRNPYDRVISLYEYLRMKGQVRKNLNFLQFCRHLDNGAIEPIGLYNKRGLSQCNPQVEWLSGIENICCLRFENFPEQLNAFADNLGIKLGSLEKLNFTSRGKMDDYYCEEAIDIVGRVYDVDFRDLGYDKR